MNREQPKIGSFGQRTYVRSFRAGAFLWAMLVIALLVPGRSGRADWRERGSDWLRTAYRWAMLPEVDDTRSHDTPWNNEDPLTSKVELSSSGPLVVGSYTTITVVYTAGRGGLPEGAAVRAAFEHGADWGQLQTSNSRRENYATVSGPRGLKWELTANYNLGVCTLLEAKVRDGRLREGDQLTMVLGDRKDGSPGFKVTTISEVPGAGRVRVFEDRSGAGQFYQMPGVPEFTVLPGLPHHLRVIARSYSAVGEPVDAVLHVDDEYNNIVSSYRGWFSVNDAGSGRRLGEARLSPDHAGMSELRGVLCREAGVLRLQVEAVGGGLSAMSNPIMCMAAGDEPRTFFGSIHNHTLMSDGLNTMEGASAYARDASNLDFFALTEHAVWPDWDYDHVLLRHNINEQQWNQAGKAARDFHRPGSFVTLLGFDWTTNTYGDKCVYFFDDRARFRKLPGDPAGLYKSLGKERAIVITNPMTGITGMRGPRWDLTDIHREHVMEIASYNGVREYEGNVYPICENDSIIPAFLVRGNFGYGALMRGLKLGFVAGADDYSGKPGAGVKGILSCSIAGLIGVRGLTLDRETIFSALESRHTYATTGARLLLDFSVNGATMGSEVVLDHDVPRVIRAEVHGEAPVTMVEVIRIDPEKPVHVWAFNPPTLDPGELSWSDTSKLDQPVWYYLRVRQNDGHLAWSSPVWVERINPE